MFLQRFLQIAFLMAGMALIIDFVLPARQQASVVTRLSMSSDTEGETIYEVSITGGDIESCAVSSSAYEQLKPGDRIVVKANQLFDTCTRITRAEEVVYSTWAQPFVSFVVGIVLFGFGLMLSKGSASPVRAPQGEA